MKESIISIRGKENINLIYSIMILGMIELIENEKISHDDSQMTLFLPLLLRSEQFNDNLQRVIGLCSELEAVSKCIPEEYKGTLDEIKRRCLRETEGYVRNDGIKYQIN